MFVVVSKTFSCQAFSVQNSSVSENRATAKLKFNNV